MWHMATTHSKIVEVQTLQEQLNYIKVKIEFSVIPDRGECQLQDSFYRIKNIVPSRSYWILKSWKYELLKYKREL